MKKGTENGQADENFKGNIIQDHLRETGENITYWREKRHLKQAELRRRLVDCLGRDISNSTLSRYINAERLMPLGVFFAISMILRVSPNELAPKELTISATTATKDSKGINFRYERLNDKNKAIIEYLIEVLLLQQRF